MRCHDQEEHREYLSLRDSWDLLHNWPVHGGGQVGILWDTKPLPVFCICLLSSERFLCLYEDNTRIS